MIKIIKIIALILSCRPSLLVAKPLKIKTVFHAGFATSRATFCEIMMPLMEQHGVVFVDNNPDVVLMCGRLAKTQKAFKVPCILLSDAEPASLTQDLKYKLRDPNLLAVFKNTTLRPKVLYNQAEDYPRYILENSYLQKRTSHEPSLEGANVSVSEPKLSNSQCDKIYTILWDIYRSAVSPNLKDIATSNIDFKTKRGIDVFFVGRVKTFYEHRMLLYEKLTTLQQLSKNLNIVAPTTCLEKSDYIELLKKSKIAISPWGVAEWCWRDYEAIYCGCVLIKPDTSFVQSVPDLYQNYKYYIPCKADFSDLGEKINYVIKNYKKLTPMRKKALKHLAEHWNYKKIASDLVVAIKRVLRANGCLPDTKRPSRGKLHDRRWPKKDTK